MAARTRKLICNNEGRFYVYRLYHEIDTLYFGKGTGDRLHNQKKQYQLNGEVVAKFKREDDAYEHERRLVDKLKPILNLCAGGAGSRATPKPIYRKTKLEKEMNAIWKAGKGRQYAAKLLLGFDLTGYVTPARIEELRQIAA